MTDPTTPIPATLCTIDSVRNGQGGVLSHTFLASASTCAMNAASYVADGITPAATFRTQAPNGQILPDGTGMAVPGATANSAVVSTLDGQKKTDTFGQPFSVPAGSVKFKP